MQSTYLCSMLELISVVPTSMSTTTYYAASVEDVFTVQLWQTTYIDRKLLLSYLNRDNKFRCIVMHQL